MAVAVDMTYLAQQIDAGRVTGGVLELGSRDRAKDGGNTRPTCTSRGLSWEGADIEPGAGVDYVLDVLDRAQLDALDRQWDSVLVFNLLEHVYDPLRALENTVELVGAGGCCVVVGPCVWQIHDYPRDYWRPLPHFFQEFAQRQGLSVEDLSYLVDDRIIPVGDLRDGEQLLLPSKQVGAKVFGRRATVSRYVHRLLNTTGREMHFPWVGLGCVLRRSG